MVFKAPFGLARIFFRPSFSSAPKRGLLKSCLAGMLLLLLSVPQGLASTLPSLQIQNLMTGNKVSIPSSFPGKTLLIAFGFHPSIQKKLEDGMFQVKQLQSQSPSLLILEIPVIEARYRSFQKPIEEFMKKQVVNKQFLPLIYPLYTDMATLKSQLNLTPKSEMAFLLCDAAGKVIWKSVGPLQPAQLETLKTQLLP